jgi:hypothetical protein
MYQPDEKDSVEILDGVPQSSIGAPIPVLLADEHYVVLAYYLQNTPAGWDGSTVRIVDPAGARAPIGIVRFAACTAHMFGPPNDEAFEGHPLAARGLGPYRAFEVKHSSWIRQLERMNSVHEHHKPESFWRQRHFVFAFHDSTFECACRSFDVRITSGSLASVVPAMLELLAWRTG